MDKRMIAEKVAENILSNPWIEGISEKSKEEVRASVAEKMEKVDSCNPFIFLQLIPVMTTGCESMAAIASLLLGHPVTDEQADDYRRLLERHEDAERICNFMNQDDGKTDYEQISPVLASMMALRDRITPFMEEVAKELEKELEGFKNG